MQADSCTAIEETECHRLRLIQFFIDYLYKICGHVVHFRKVFVGLAHSAVLFAEHGLEGFDSAVFGLSWQCCQFPAETKFTMTIPIFVISCNLVKSWEMGGSDEKDVYLLNMGPLVTTFGTVYLWQTI